MHLHVHNVVHVLQVLLKAMQHANQQFRESAYRNYI